MAGETTAERSDSPAPSTRRPSAARRPRRPSRRAVVAGLAAVGLLVAGGTYLLYGSPWLRVGRITVSGTRVLTPEQVRAASGVPTGEALASVDPAQVESAVGLALPRIDSVVAERSWPDTLVLKVTERTPRALLKKGGKFIEVDANGVRYATDPTAPAGVPLVELTASASAAKGYFSTEVLLHAAVQVAADLPESVHKQTKSIRVVSFDAISLELTGGRSVLWGGPQDGAHKGVALTALLKAATGATHYDVSAPAAPASSGS